MGKSWLYNYFHLLLIIVTLSPHRTTLISSESTYLWREIWWENVRKWRNTVTNLLPKMRAGFRRPMSCVLSLEVFIFECNFLLHSSIIVDQFSSVWQYDLKVVSTFSLQTFLLLFGITEQDAGSVYEYLLNITAAPQEFIQLSYLRFSKKADYFTVSLSTNWCLMEIWSILPVSASQKPKPTDCNIRIKLVYVHHQPNRFHILPKQRAEKHRKQKHKWHKFFLPLPDLIILKKNADDFTLYYIKLWKKISSSIFIN